MTILINEPVTHSKFSTGDTEIDKLFYPKIENILILIYKLNEQCDFHVHVGKVRLVKHVRLHRSSWRKYLEI